MTIRVVLSCDGQEGILPCRQATPVGEVSNAGEARRIAKAVHGWSWLVLNANPGGKPVLDFCRACTKRRQER